MNDRQATATAEWLRRLGAALRSRIVISIEEDDDGAVIETARYQTRAAYWAGREVLDDFDKMLAHDAAVGTAVRSAKFS